MLVYKNLFINIGSGSGLGSMNPFISKVHSTKLSKKIDQEVLKRSTHNKKIIENAVKATAEVASKTANTPNVKPTSTHTMPQSATQHNNNTTTTSSEFSTATTPNHTPSSTSVPTTFSQSGGMSVPLVNQTPPPKPAVSFFDFLHKKQHQESTPITNADTNSHTITTQTQSSGLEIAHTKPVGEKLIQQRDSKPISKTTNNSDIQPVNLEKLVDNALTTKIILSCIKGENESQEVLSLEQKRNVFTKFLEGNTLPSKNIIESLLQSFNDIAPETINKNDEILLMKLNVFIADNTLDPKYYPEPYSRNTEEYKMFLNDNTGKDSTEIVKKLTEFFKQEPIGKCITVKNYEYEIKRNEQGLDIIINYSDKVKLKEFLEVIRRAPMLFYADALFVDNTGNRKIMKEGQGAKLSQQAYRIIKHNNLFKQAGGDFPDKDKIIKDVEEGKVFAGLIDRDLNSNIILLSGIDLHVVYVIVDPVNPDCYLVLGFATSAKDDTIMLSKTQHDLTKELDENNQGIDKAQMIRIAETLIRIPKEHFKELPTATKHLTTAKTDDGTKNVFDIFIEGVKNKASIFTSRMIEDPIDFTREKLREIAEKFFMNNIEELKKSKKNLETELDRMPKKKKLDKELLLKNLEVKEKNNQKEQAYISSLPENFQLLIRLRNRLKYLLETRNKALEIQKSKENRVVLKELKEKQEALSKVVKNHET